MDKERAFRICATIDHNRHDYMDKVKAIRIAEKAYDKASLGEDALWKVIGFLLDSICVDYCTYRETGDDPKC